MKKTTQDTEIFSVIVRTEDGSVVVTANLGAFDNSAGVTGSALADAFGRASADLYTSYFAIVRESGLDRQTMADAMRRATERHLDALHAAAMAEAGEVDDPGVPMQ